MSTYNLMDILNRRMDAHTYHSSVPNTAIEFENCRQHLQGIVSTKFDINSVVHCKDSGDQDDPSTYYIPSDKGKEMMDFYNTYGFVQISGVLSESECEEAIWEILKEVIGTQGLQDQYQIDIPVKRGNVSSIKLNALDPNLDLEEYKRDILDFFTQDQFSAKDRKALEKSWTRHADFGASTDVSNFHLPTQWKLRQDPRLMKIFQMLYAVESVWCTMNRAIEKLPNKGDDEFCHVDVDSNIMLQGIMDNNKAAGSKLVYNESHKFSAIIGSQTKEFATWFKDHYGPLYQGTKQKPGMFMISKDDPKKDPCGLWNLLSTIELEPGSLILWNYRLFHNARPNPKDKNILFGDYSAAMVVNDGKQCQTPSMIRSCWKNATVPATFPSGDKIPAFGHTKKMANFPKQITSRRNRLDHNNPYVQKGMLSYQHGFQVRRHFKNGLSPILSFKSMPVSKTLQRPTLTNYTKRQFAAVCIQSKWRAKHHPKKGM